MTRAREHRPIRFSHSVTMARNRPSRLKSQAARDTVLKAVAAGSTVTQAAEAAGVARETAQRWVRSAQLRRSDRHAAELVEAARRAAKPASPGTAPRRVAGDPAELQRQLDAARVREQALADELRAERELRESKDREVRELRQRDPWQRRAVDLALGTLDVLPYDVWCEIFRGRPVEVLTMGQRHRVELHPDHVAALREAANRVESMRYDEVNQRADRPIAAHHRARRDRLARLWRAEEYGGADR